MRQRLTKQQILVAHLLGLSSENLEQEISKEVEENPFLEEVIEDTSASSAETDNDTTDALDPNDEYYTHTTYDYDDYRSAQTRSDNSDNTPFQQADETSFQTSLIEQLNMAPLTERQKVIGNELIGNIDEAGYMTRHIGIVADDLAIRRNLEVSETEVEEVLATIQTFEPAGVGARNLQECLSLQLHRKTDNNTALANAIAVIDDHFDDFANHRYEKICKQLNISEEELLSASDLIRTLNPKPCDGTTTAAPSLIPDFFIVRQGEHLSFTINERNRPKLRKDESFIERLSQEAKRQSDAQRRETQNFIKKNTKDAEMFISAIEQRYNTLQLVMSAIMKYQKRYLITGNVADLRPMLQKNIAETTGLDISTISRVVNQKYALTEHGIILLKDLFSNALQKDDGSDTTTKAIKELLKNLIDNEDKKKPLTDEELCVMLEQHGFPLARRTVAKYRETIGIPTARLRKEL